MTQFISLLYLVISPLIAGGLILLPKFPNHEVKIRRFAKGFCALHFVYSLLFLLYFDTNSYLMSFEQTLTFFHMEWVKPLGLNMTFAIDGISLLLCILCSFIFFIVVFMSKYYIRTNVRLYYALVLFLQMSIIGTLCAKDMFLFLFFIELAIVPVYFLVTLFSNENAKNNALRYVFTMLTAGMFLLFAMLVLYFYNFAVSDILSANIEDLSIDEQIYPLWFQLTIFLSFLVGFLPKMAIFPFHNWFVSVNKKAVIPVNIVTSTMPIILGAYGIIRFNIQIFPNIFKIAAPFLLVLALMTIFYSAFILVSQLELKKIFSYLGIFSSGIMLLGLSVLNEAGFSGALYMIIAYTLTITGLYCVAGPIELQLKTLRLTSLSGLAQLMPKNKSFFTFFTFSAIGLPFLATYPAIFLISLGAFSSGLDNQLLVKFSVACLAFGLLVVAIKLFDAYKKIFYGEVAKNTEKTKDITFSQASVLYALSIALIGLGVLPQNILNVVKSTIAVIMDLVGI